MQNIKYNYKKKYRNNFNYIIFFFIKNFIKFLNKIYHIYIWKMNNLLKIEKTYCINLCRCKYILKFYHWKHCDLFFSYLLLTLYLVSLQRNIEYEWRDIRKWVCLSLASRLLNVKVFFDTIRYYSNFIFRKQCYLYIFLNIFIVSTFLYIWILIRKQKMIMIT